MKYNRVGSFEKHLSEASPSHLSEIYLLIDPEDYVQKKKARSIPPPGAYREFFDESSVRASVLSDFFEMPSMFAKEKWGIFVGVDLFSKNISEKLFRYCSHLPENIRVVLTASVSLPEFKKLEKKAVSLDLSGEKPWEREERYRFYIQKEFDKNNCRISPVLANAFLKKCGIKEAFIDREIEKMVCYLKDRREFREKDLDLLQENFRFTLFKIGRDILENRLEEALHVIRSLRPPALSVLYAIRNLYRQCYRMKELPPDQWEKHFPQVKGNLLQKNKEWVDRHSGRYFQEGLKILFDGELFLKTEKIEEEFFLRLLIFKLGGLHRTA